MTLQTENENKIEYLGLKGCAISKDDLSIIVNSLKDLSSLKTLDISENNISIDEANKLLEAQGISKVKITKN